MKKQPRLCVLTAAPPHRLLAALPSSLFLLWLTAAVCIALGVPAQAQVPAGAKPYYLTTMQPIVSNGGYHGGTATLLGKSYLKSVSWDGRPNGIDCRFKVPDGYNRFIALAGVDDSSQETIPCTFTVIGVGDDGVERVLDTEDASPLQKPQAINVPLTNVQILILRLSSDTGPYAYGNAWWGDARFVAGRDNAQPQDNSDNPQPASSAPTQLVVAPADLQGQMQTLVKKLLAAANMPVGSHWEVSVGRFTLVPLPNETLTDDNADVFQKALTAALGQDGTLDVTATKEFLSRSFPDSWAPGDDLNDTVRGDVRKSVDTRYVLLGNIADRSDPDEATVSAALYDLRTGKSPTDEQRVRIPLQSRQALAAPGDADGSGDGGGVADSVPVTLVFSPDADLHIHNYQWSVDDTSKPQRQLSNLNSQTVLVPPDGKTHHFTLQWSGDGATLTPIFGPKKQSYQSVTVEFDVNVSASERIELTAKADLIMQGLTVLVRAGDQQFKPQWH